MKKLIALTAVFAPTVAFAAQPIVDANSLVAKFTSIGNTAIGVLISFAVIWIIYNVVRFIASSGEGRDGFRSNFLWGIVGLAVILSIWGLVAILTNTFQTDTRAPTNDYPVNTYPPVIQ